MNLEKCTLTDIHQLAVLNRQLIDDEKSNNPMNIKENEPIGFLYLKETGNSTVELYVMGILKEFHRNGIGRELFDNAKKVANEKGQIYIMSLR